jgi:hypothetical protein
MKRLVGRKKRRSDVVFVVSQREAGLSTICFNSYIFFYAPSLSRPPLKSLKPSCQPRIFRTQVARDVKHFSAHVIDYVVNVCDGEEGDKVDD